MRHLEYQILEAKYIWYKRIAQNSLSSIEDYPTKEYLAEENIRLENQHNGGQNMPEKEEEVIQKVREGLIKKAKENPMPYNIAPLDRYIDRLAARDPSAEVKQLKKEEEKLSKKKLTQYIAEVRSELENSKKEIKEIVENSKKKRAENYGKTSQPKVANKFTAKIELSPDKTNVLTKTPLGKENRPNLKKGTKNSVSWADLEESKKKLQERNQSLSPVEGKEKANPIEFNNFKRLKGLYEGKNTIYGTNVSMVSALIPTLIPDLVIKGAAVEKPHSQELDQVEKKIKNFQDKFKDTQQRSPEEKVKECREIIKAIDSAIKKAEKQYPELTKMIKEYVSNEVEIKEIEKRQKQLTLKQARDIGRRSLDQLMKAEKSPSNITASSSVPHLNIAQKNKQIQPGR